MSEAQSNNPLLALQPPIPFDRISAEHVEPAVDALLEEARRDLRALESGDVELTYEATLGALERLTERLGRAVNIVGHLESVASEPGLRDAYNAIQPKVSELFSGIPLSEGLWGLLQRYADTDEARSLQGARARVLKKTLDEFRREGAELEADGKRRLNEINVELGKLTSRFAQNVLDATNDYELLVEDAAALKGLPQDALEAAGESARQKGKQGYRLTLQAPSFVPAVTHLEDASLREQLYRAQYSRATREPYDNRPLIARILQLRAEKARLLGYASFADLVLEDRMAKRGDKAKAFVEDLRERTADAARRENVQLEAFRKQLEGEAAPPLQPWDVPFYAEKLRKELFDFDEEELKPYFPLPRVLDGLFELVHRLYGIRVREVEDMPTWDAAVRCYAVDDEDGTRLGTFYADLFPRENKRGGAWMNDFITGGPLPEGGREGHVGVICANLNPPLGDKPALLSHSDVETLFHEFGHLMHHMLSRVEVRSLAGTNVAWDFVELPSQIMQNWCWEREALDLFARHYETGETIPRPLFDKLRRSRTFRAANAAMRQLGFARLDLALHIDYAPERDGDVMAYARRIAEAFSPVPLPRDYAMVAGFGHLFAGPVAYAAGYYSYKWAEVLDADAFSRFENEGLFSREVGREFRERILAQGDSRDPMDLFRDFMRREPKLEPLLQRAGIQTPGMEHTDPGTY